MNEITLIRKDILSMSSREIAELTGSTHDNVLKTIRKLVIEGVVFGNETPYVHPQNGQTYSEYLLSFRNTMIVVSGYSAELRAKIIDRWQELESQVATPAELSTLEILAIAMESEKGRLLAIEQRDHAIATKAHISSKREVTAMVTASKAVREAAKLRDELGRNQRHATVTAVENASGLKFPTNAYVPLRKWCKKNDASPVSVVDTRFGSVKAWPAGAWLAAYDIDLGDLFIGGDA